MQTVNTAETRMPFRDRLSTRLGLLFFVVFLGTLVVMGAWALLTMVGDRSQTSDTVNVLAQPVVIDPKIGTDLAKALAFDAVPAVTQVQNPFVDRASLSGSPAAAAIVARAASTSPSSSAVASTKGAGTGNSVSLGGASRPSSGTPGMFTVPMESTRSRYDSWIASQNRGEFVVPESEVLGVDDLVPVGFATGGSRGPEVMLFSLSLCRTFSFPTGTRFYDGLLNGFDQREVVFIYMNGVRRKSYATEEVCAPAADNRGGGTSN